VLVEQCFIHFFLHINHVFLTFPLLLDNIHACFTKDLTTRMKIDSSLSITFPFLLIRGKSQKEN
jgi:hypothetical protein